MQASPLKPPWTMLLLGVEARSHRPTLPRLYLQCPHHPCSDYSATSPANGILRNADNRTSHMSRRWYSAGVYYRNTLVILAYGFDGGFCRRCVCPTQAMVVVLVLCSALVVMVSAGSHVEGYPTVAKRQFWSYARFSDFRAGPVAVAGRFDAGRNFVEDGVYGMMKLCVHVGHMHVSACLQNMGFAHPTWGPSLKMN